MPKNITNTVKNLIDKLKTNDVEGADSRRKEHITIILNKQNTSPNAASEIRVLKDNNVNPYNNLGKYLSQYADPLDEYLESLKSPKPNPPMKKIEYVLTYNDVPMPITKKSNKPLNCKGSK
jgi:hypothetical protein